MSKEPFNVKNLVKFDIIISEENFYKIADRTKKDYLIIIKDIIANDGRPLENIEDRPFILKFKSKFSNNKGEGPYIIALTKIRKNLDYYAVSILDIIEISYGESNDQI